jgi:two-component system response regulator MprA
MKQVLVVDDHLEGLRLVCRMLKISGFETASCSNGALALEYLDQHRQSVGLVITDWAMPGIDGLQVCRRAVDLGIPTIVLTALSRPQDYQEVVDTGAVEHLIKPVTHTVLARAVKQHMLTGDWDTTPN